MPAYRHIVTLPYNTGLPRDVAVNVFHSQGDTTASAAQFADHLVTFYGAIDQLLSNQLSSAANAASVRTYDLTDLEPRAPVDVQNFTLTLNASTLAMEMAICLSFQATKISGAPQARRRGRVYLGPLGGVMDSTTGRPQSAHITTIATAAATLLANGETGPSAFWSIFSPTTGLNPLVADGWVDNEFDTVRRRGRVATARTLWS